MATVKIADVRKTLPLAKSLMRRLDVDKDARVSREEVARLKNKDDFTARNFVNASLDRLSWPDSPGPYPLERIAAVFEGAIESLQRADRDGDGALDDAELKRASRVARSFVEFTKKYAGQRAAVFEVVPYEKPGTKPWVELAKRDYFGRPNEPMNRPYFGTALVLNPSQLPTPAHRAAYQALVDEFPGRTVQARRSVVNGAPVFLMHAMSPTRYDVRVLDARGAVLAEGVARPRPDPRSNWTVRWD